MAIIHTRARGERSDVSFLLSYILYICCERLWEKILRASVSIHSIGREVMRSRGSHFLSWDLGLGKYFWAGRRLGKKSPGTLCTGSLALLEDFSNYMPNCRVENSEFSE